VEELVGVMAVPTQRKGMIAAIPTHKIAPIFPVMIGNVSMSTTTREDEVRTELDNHADTCVVGDNTALVIHEFDQTVRVHGYTKSIGAMKAKTVSAVVAYDHPETGDTYMLVIHQVILVPKLKSNLLCPMQLHDFDIRVNDKPKYMVPNRQMIIMQSLHLLLKGRSLFAYHCYYTVLCPIFQQES
jgi:hypothetical protein